MVGILKYHVPVTTIVVEWLRFGNACAVFKSNTLERDYFILFRPYVYTIELLLCWSGWKTANYLIITKTIMVLLEGSFEIGVTTGQDTHNRFKHLYLNNSDGWLRVHPMNCNHNSLCTVQGPRCLLACCTLTSLCTSSCGLNEQKTILK